MDDFLVSTTSSDYKGRPFILCFRLNVGFFLNQDINNI